MKYAPSGSLVGEIAKQTALALASWVSTQRFARPSKGTTGSPTSAAQGPLVHSEPRSKGGARALPFFCLNTPILVALTTCRYCLFPISPLVSGGLQPSQ